MCQLFETVCCVDGVFRNIEEHTNRINKAHEEISSLILPDINQIVIPQEYTKGVSRCRIDYSTLSDPIISFYAYKPRRINTLKIIECNDIDYHLKYADRSILNSLVEKKENADEILIVKNGLLTDTSYTNIVLFDGNQCFTPKQPLLKGTQRSYLLKQSKIIERDLSINDLSKYWSVYMINAMMSLDNCPVVSVSSIF